MVDLIAEGKTNKWRSRWGPRSSVSAQGGFRCGPGCDSAKVAVNLGYYSLHFTWG